MITLFLKANDDTLILFLKKNIRRGNWKITYSVTYLNSL